MRNLADDNLFGGLRVNPLPNRDAFDTSEKCDVVNIMKSVEFALLHFQNYSKVKLHF